MRTFIISLALFISFQSFSFENDHNLTVQEDSTEAAIKWLDFESAIDANEEKRKPIFIDIYTSWCGWCVKMDNSTFKDSRVVDFINENFYAVKMDAESKEPIAFKEHLYEYKIYPSGKGYNELAVNLLANKLSFPTYVILNKRQARVGAIKGYKKPKELIAALRKYA